MGTVSSSSSGSSLSSMFQVSGLASGIDTASIVSKLMQLEQRPLTKLQDSQTKLLNRKAGLTEIASKLSTLRTASSTLMLSTATQTRSASSTNTAVATATASANTSLQSFTVNVSQLATRTTMTSGAAIGTQVTGATTIAELPNTNLTTGSGTITVGIRNAATGVVTTKEITVQASDQLESVRQAVEDAFNLNLLPSGGATGTLTNGQFSFVAPVGYELIFGGAGDTSNVFAATNLATATADTTATAATTLVEAGWNYIDPSTGSVALNPTMTLTHVSGGVTRTATINVGTSDKISDIVTSINQYLQGAVNIPTTGPNAGVNIGGLGLTNATATFSNGRITVSNYNGTLAFGSDGTQYGNSLLSALKLPTTATGSPAASSGDITTTKRTYTATSAVTTVSPTATLDTALGLTGSSEFRINGTLITWDATTDTINTLVSRINSSGAGVLASFDSLTGRMSLQNRTTGATGITIDDNYGTGNYDLTDALKLTTNGGNLDAPVTSLGQNARYSINGGAVQTSTSNTVTRAISGVTLNLTGTLNTTATISIGQDTTAAVANVKTFVTAYNDALKWVQENTKVDAARRTRGAFAGDAMIEGIMTRLRGVVNTAASGLTTTYKSLPSIGLSSGAVGSAVGTTSSLVLDETKFTEALTSNPEAVQNLFGLSGGPLDSLKTYLISATSFSGMLNSSQTSADTQLRDLDRRITDMQSRLDQKQAALQKKYSDLESTLSKLQAQSSSLSQQLAGLSNNNK